MEVSLPTILILLLIGLSVSLNSNPFAKSQQGGNPFIYQSRNHVPQKAFNQLSNDDYQKHYAKNVAQHQQVQQQNQNRQQPQAYQQQQHQQQQQQQQQQQLQQQQQQQQPQHQQQQQQQPQHQQQQQQQPQHQQPQHQQPQQQQHQQKQQQQQQVYQQVYQQHQLQQEQQRRQEQERLLQLKIRHDRQQLLKEQGLQNDAKPSEVARPVEQGHKGKSDSLPQFPHSDDRNVGHQPDFRNNINREAVYNSANGSRNQPVDASNRQNRPVDASNNQQKISVEDRDTERNGGFQKQFVPHGGKGEVIHMKNLENTGSKGKAESVGEKVYYPKVSEGVQNVVPVGTDTKPDAIPTPRRGDIPVEQDPNIHVKAVVHNDGNDDDGQNLIPELATSATDNPAIRDRPGVIRTVNDPVEPYQNNGQQENVQNFNNFPNQRQRERDIGGLRLSWDWSDFSVTFDDYGAAELKVRRAPHATTGEPWPLPQYYIKKKKRVFKIDKDAFHFKIVAETCDLIEEGIQRYRKRVLEDAVEDMYDNLQNAEGTRIDNPTTKYEQDMYKKASIITSVEVKIHKPCSKYPSVDADESYDLKVKKNRASIMAKEVWGALRGLETFSQLVWKGLDGEDPDDRGKNANLYVKECIISDYPRFSHRGLLIDSSRHFIFKEVIFDILDGMEQNKMNVMHWHIVDDQSFPYQSEVFPELSKKGAFHPSFVYTQEDLREIIDYARFRGVRVMPEFDTPGHTYSWGLSRPELLTQCYQGAQPVKGYLGPIDPTKNSTYRFLRTLFTEVLEVFKDQYIHLGGDEVPLSCWSSNPEVVNFGLDLQKKQDGVYGLRNDPSFYQNTQFDIRKVYEYYVNRLIKDLNEIGKKKKEGIKFIMWQEVMNNDLQLPNDTIIEVWMGDMADVSRAIGMGYKVVYATCWYLDHIEYGTKWTKYYQCDPADNTFGYTIDEKMVLGGEACLWSEYVDNENLMTTLWPRASATAERLWSAKDVRDLDAAGARLQEHRCRMLSRGLSVAQISGPDYCLRRGFGRRGDQKEHNSTCTSGRCVKSRDNNFVEIEDFKLHLSRRGSQIANCQSSAFGTSSIFILGTLAVILFAIVIGYQKSGGRLPSYKICKNRTILILFASVLFIYFMCYTTIWMNVFEFSGTFHKRHESNRLGDVR